MKFTADNIKKLIVEHIEKSINDKISHINSDEVTVTYDGNINYSFSKDLSEDERQNKAGVLLSGGHILTKEGEEKKKNGELLTDDDYVYITGLGRIL